VFQSSNAYKLGKWLFKLSRACGKLSLSGSILVQKHYLRFFEKPGDLHFWAGLMATKKYFFGLGSFSIKDGSEIRFWEDKWLGNVTLRD
jgi:hypothetical protein